MNVSLTDKQRKYIDSQVQSGDYQNASEVMREALRLHELYRVRLINDLRAEIDKGWNSPVSARSLKSIAKGKSTD